MTELRRWRGVVVLLGPPICVMMKFGFSHVSVNRLGIQSSEVMITATNGGAVSRAQFNDQLHLTMGLLV